MSLYSTWILAMKLKYHKNDHLWHDNLSVVKAKMLLLGSDVNHTFLF